MIVVRLVRHQSYLRKVLGPGHGSPYTRIMAMTVESAALLILVGIPYVFLVGYQNPDGSMMLLSLLPQICVGLPFIHSCSLELSDWSFEVVDIAVAHRLQGSTRESYNGYAIRAWRKSLEEDGKASWTRNTTLRLADDVDGQYIVVPRAKRSRNCSHGTMIFVVYVRLIQFDRFLSLYVEKNLYRWISITSPSVSMQKVLLIFLLACLALDLPARQSAFHRLTFLNTS